MSFPPFLYVLDQLLHRPSSSIVMPAGGAVQNLEELLDEVSMPCPGWGVGLPAGGAAQILHGDLEGGF